MVQLAFYNEGLMKTAEISTSVFIYKRMRIGTSVNNH